MERYINQLLEDLEQAAVHPPAPAYLEAPYPGADSAATEIARSPYQSLSELTGIPGEAFPPVWDLVPDQMDAVVKAVFKVFETFKIDLVDAPDNLPVEIYYISLTGAWDDPIQYLPDAGFDLELCTGDPQTCPYGEYCDCGDPDIDDDINGLPDEENSDWPGDRLPF